MKPCLHKFTITLFSISLIWACSESSDDQDPQPPQIQEDIAVIDQKIEQFLDKWDYPGATLAISKNGKLVYSKGYGMADVEANQAMTADSRMRIASISKTFTGVAVLRLVQDGKLNLDDKVFGEGGILGNDFGTPPYSERVRNVTVRQLLHMTTGGWVLTNDRDAIDNNTGLAVALLFNGCVDYTNATIWNNFNQEFFALANELVSQNVNVYKDIDQF